MMLKSDQFGLGARPKTLHSSKRLGEPVVETVRKKFVALYCHVRDT